MFEVVALGWAGQLLVPLVDEWGSLDQRAVEVVESGEGPIYAPFVMERRYLPLQNPELSAPSDLTRQ